jgi:hypothetical protein
MISHSVFMKLKHPKGSVEEGLFLEAAAKLETIPGVIDYQIVREVSLKNNFEFGLTMKFKSEEDYYFYNEHALHVAFVENTWLPNVEAFQEIDYIILLG